LGLEETVSIYEGQLQMYLNTVVESRQHVVLRFRIWGGGLIILHTNT